MQLYFYCISVLFFIWIARNILFWVSLWQNKVYRLARVSAHIRETVQGRELLLSYFSLAKWGLFLSYIFVIVNDKVTSFYQILVGLLYIAEALVVFTEIKQHRLTLPSITPKTITICILTFIAVVILFLTPITDGYLWMLFLDRMVVVFIALFVFFFAFPTEILHDITVQKAIAKIKQNKQLLIIAVSGSYGKSSTKEFIAQLLSPKYTVVATPHSMNAPIDVAHTILSEVRDTTEVLIIEMGAEKKGDNEEICQIVTPSISVTTSVSDQHLSIFGTIENVYETEMELIHALPKDGIALFNGNSDGAYKLYKKTKKKKILYKCTANASAVKANFSATTILVKENKIVFTLHFKAKTIRMKTPLLGAHMVENVLPAIYIAHFLGLSMTKIKRDVAHLTPPAKTMVKIEHRGITLIDDTFNASPESVFAAANYMSIYKKKKIIVLMPLLELGSNAKKRHIELGECLAKICDYLFLTNNNFYTEIMSGVNRKESNCKLFVAQPLEIVKQLQTIEKKGDVILFEGKEAAAVLNRLL